ncbi:copper homeostasis protein CutC [Paeniglutamicibacter gangotriensis]|uniref:PF03932 family protein CutC n=1 Tax=Paeniglutamicibacter gangotriensis TaxID=254787 RepID=A0A5B0EJJ9_9MICC|nr:copper homeostasis protein CutC [Paeniglutamicibacter gangotriensis]KAA0978876.1 copper homeostasis protein CutC [Paeniglutamicibacter gangotriensis]
MTKLEIAVQDAVGARIALENGADRVELCSALGMGGLTPTLGTIEAAVAVGIGVHVLIRPRGGGYTYTSAEIELMAVDISRAAHAGVAGIVIGALTEDDAALDIEVLATLVAAAHTVNRDIEITVHRCVDVLLENGMSVVELIAQLRSAGAHRILTSGGAPVSGAGAEVLHRLRTEAAGNPQVQAGGGVTIEDIPVLSFLDGIHLSARTQTIWGASGPGGGESTFDVTSSEQVAAAAAALAKAE